MVGPLQERATSHKIPDTYAESHSQCKTCSTLSDSRITAIPQTTGAQVHSRNAGLVSKKASFSAFGSGPGFCDSLDGSPLRALSLSCMSSSILSPLSPPPLPPPNEGDGTWRATAAICESFNAISFLPEFSAHTGSHCPWLPPSSLPPHTTAGDRSTVTIFFTFC